MGNFSEERPARGQAGPGAAPPALPSGRRMNNLIPPRDPSLLWFLAALALFTLAVTISAQGSGLGLLSTSFVKTLGKTLCLCLVALALDLIWGYAGILSLGHMAFFALGGYMVGMWLMFARTREIVVQSLATPPCPPRQRKSPKASPPRSLAWSAGPTCP